MAETDTNGTPSAAQPGQVIAPGGAPTPPAAAPPPSVPVLPPSQAAPLNTAAPATDQTAPPAAPSPPVAPAADGTITWTASEFVAHEKGSSWYLALGGIAVVAAALVFLIARDIVSIVVILMAAFAFGVLGSRKPRQQGYSLGPAGLTIGQRHFGYDEFRSFSVVPEGAFSSIVFMPLKRFAPLTTIYYAPEDEDRIIDLISASLPFEERKADPIDRLMSRIRF